MEPLISKEIIFLEKVAQPLQAAIKNHRTRNKED